MYWILRLHGGPRVVNHAAAAIGNIIYSFGGYCSEVDDSEDGLPIWVYALDTRDNRWTVPSVNITPDEPTQRYGHTVVAYDNKLYLWGGRDNYFNIFDKLTCFDPETARYHTVPVTGDRPHARDGHSACVVGHKMYIFGGYDTRYSDYSNDVHVFDFLTRNWIGLRTTGTPPSPRDFHSATAVGHHMYVFGGRGIDSAAHDDTYCPVIRYLDTIKNEWITPQASGDVPSGRRSHSAWLYNGDLYIFGGYNRNLEEHFNDVYRFCISTGKWSLLKFPGCVPNRRRRQCCVLSGKKVYLFGGTRPYLKSQHDILMDLDDLHVLDYEPSLKTLAILAVWKYNLNLDSLPPSVISDVQNMTQPNNISMTGPDEENVEEQLQNV